MNPVIAREFISQLRTPRTFVQLTILLLLATLVFCIGYFQTSMEWIYGRMDGRSLFFPIIIITTLLAIPIATMASSMIAREREENTWELLLTTPMYSIRILWGKCMAPLLYALILLTSLTPFLGLCFLIGGLSPGEVMQCCVLIGGLYCLVMMIGITVSLFAQSAGSAARISILLLIAYLFGPLAGRFIYITYWYGVSGPSPKLGLELWINPIWALFEVYAPKRMSFPMCNLDEYYFLSVLTPLQSYPGLLTGLFLFALSILLFLFTAIAYYFLAPLLTNDFSWKQLWQARRNKRKYSTPVSREDTIVPYFGLRFRAISQKEILEQNRKLLSRDLTLVIACGLLSAFLAWLMFDASNVKDLSHRMTYSILAIFGVGITCLFTPIAPSYTLLQERRRDTWPMLRVTAIRSIDIVIGKVYGAFRQSAIPLLSIFFFFYCSTAVLFRYHEIVPEENYLPQITALVVLLLVCAFFYSSVGVLYSSGQSKWKASPHRKTFSIVLLHVILPYLIYGIVLGMYQFFSITQSGFGMQRWPPGGPSDSVFKMLDRVLKPFSPIHYMFEVRWDLSTYVAAFIHEVVLITLSVIVIGLAGVRIRKRD
ncbi:MAG: hypothetical protein C4527_28730 [Candidatus Omnitrophota bacterium]|jgi:hypothetical protein|nr:MAG: hypothetical protein C4527_28730 [Candidatus Omnitrophota bacterium]